ncbi:MAG: diguanylate cyclase, partial [Alphaproteobacteria bacterium]|nr:diguanylate cyclase [Alphaproteobacteria bacterium]
MWPFKDRAETDRRGAVESEASGGRLGLDPRSLLAHFPGPALLADAQGRVFAANLEAEGIAKAIESGALRDLALRIPLVAADGRPSVEKATLPRGREGSDLAYEFSLLPTRSGRDGVAVLVLGRETTMERNLTAALIDSRQRFKDLIDCSSDFAWETNAKGRFAFVSVRGALGYRTAELDGRLARTLYREPPEPGTPIPFEAKEPVHDIEVWVKRADGDEACLLISAVPITDRASGDWLGARGVAKDVTEARQREAALERARQREALIDQIVDTVRDEAKPRQMLTIAAEQVAKAVGARECWIFRPAVKGSHFVCEATSGAEAAQRNTDAASALAEAAAKEATRPIEIGGFLVVVTRYGGRVNGGMCLARAGAWSGASLALTEAVAAHVGVALRQAANLRELKRLSQRDALTDLYNRRAFFADVARRLVHGRRIQKSAALVYVDLDNFKPVNDRHGHQAG